MEVKEVQTFTATIWCGLEVRDTKRLYDIQDAINIVHQYCNEHKLCVTVTPTTFVYVGQTEPGFSVGLINYPRFPSTPEKIGSHALELARKLLIELFQYKVSVVFPDGNTVMLSNEPFGTPDPRK